MKKFLLVLTVSLMFFGMMSAAEAVVIDFESIAIGDYSAPLVFGDFTITDVDNSFQVLSSSPGWPISGNVLYNSNSPDYTIEPWLSKTIINES